MAHWFLFGLALLTLSAGLVVDGYVHHSVGAAATQPATGRRLGLHVGPLLSSSATGWRSLPTPDRTVALTFDDGPDPRWTPQVLDILHRDGVRATFFVVGSRVVDHPDLVRRELAAGDSVGSHTFTHADLTNLPGWRRSLELRMTQVALASATGHHTALFRPPYSSVPAALTAAQERAFRSVAHQGYLVVLADRDAEDWRRPGTAAIVANAMPTAGAGAIVLLHDGGGDRSQTVQALPRLILALRSRGYRFVTVPQLAHLAGSVALPVVSGREHLYSRALTLTIHAAHLVTVAVAALAVLLLVLTLGRALLLVTLAHRHTRQGGTTGIRYSPLASVIVPAFNEELGIAATLRSLQASTYPNLEVIVVDDGSTDGTAAQVKTVADPRLTLVRQANAGKPAALDAGLARSRGEVVVTIDADTTVNPDAVSRLVAPFWNRRVGATSGNTKVANRGGLLGRWQHLEYVMGLNLDRRMLHMLGCVPTVPGAIGAFRRSTLLAIGGFSADTLAEDTDATMAIHRAGQQVLYVDDAIAWTEAPSKLGDLWRQRYRWSYGTMQSIAKHIGAVREPTARRLGLIGLPYLLLFQVLLALLAPLVDVFFIFGLFFLNPWPVLAFWLGFNALQLALCSYALRLDGERQVDLWALPLQQVVYRQLMYLVVIQSVINALMGTRLRWQRARRTGAATLPRREPALTRASGAETIR